MFPWIIFDEFGMHMPIENAYSSGRIVRPFSWGLAYAVIIDTSFPKPNLTFLFQFPTVLSRFYFFSYRSSKSC